MRRALKTGRAGRSPFSEPLPQSGSPLGGPLCSRNSESDSGAVAGAPRTRGGPGRPRYSELAAEPYDFRMRSFKIQTRASNSLKSWGPFTDDSIRRKARPAAEEAAAAQCFYVCRRCRGWRVRTGGHVRARARRGLEAGPAAPDSANFARCRGALRALPDTARPDSGTARSDSILRRLYRFCEV